MSFEILESQVGYVKVDDGTELSIRFAVVHIREQRTTKPTGPDFGIDYTVQISTESPQELKQKVKSKRTRPSESSYLQNLEIWEIVKIEERKSGYEEVQYTATDGHTYKIHYGVEPAIVARTLEYKDLHENPVYYVRWGTRTMVHLIQ